MGDTNDEEPRHQPEAGERDRARKRRGNRRVTAAGTGPTADAGPEPRTDAIQPEPQGSKKNKLSERDRWMLEQKPPHY